jgi:hypothetical protein
MNLKKNMLLAWLLGIAFTVGSSAQTYQETSASNQQISPLQDTLALHLGGTSRIFITGRTLREISTYTKADSLKELFLDDFEKLYKGQSQTEIPQVIHYLVHGSGKRRMKVGTDMYNDVPFDLAKEKQRLNLDLPKWEYTIYDLAREIEIHFYLEDSNQLSLLDDVSLSEAIQRSRLNAKKFKQT